MNFAKLPTFCRVLALLELPTVSLITNDAFHGNFVTLVCFCSFILPIWFGFSDRLVVNSAYPTVHFSWILTPVHYLPCNQELHTHHWLSDGCVHLSPCFFFLQFCALSSSDLSVYIVKPKFTQTIVFSFMCTCICANFAKLYCILHFSLPCLV